MLLGFLALAWLAGCAKPTDPSTSPMADAPSPVSYQLFAGTKAWPATPGAAPTSLTFTVPANATALHVFFTWHGQAPGGYSATYSATLVAPDGKERKLAGESIPAGPYLCAGSACGPAEKQFDYDQGLAGTWTLRLEGAYTATAVLSAMVDASR
jgi:hypothetical protein